MSRTVFRTTAALLFFCAGLSIAQSAVLGDEQSPANNVERDPSAFVEKALRPVIQKYCISCHGPSVQKANLRLDVRSRFFKGGESGSAVIPGMPERSELLRRLASHDPDEQMPPEGPRVPDDVILQIRTWIADGAEWKETDYDRHQSRDTRLDHWAWQPLLNTGVPEVADTVITPADGPTIRLTEIDRFIGEQLTTQSLQFSPKADRRTLIRRLSFDLLGLPPEPEDVEQFERDESEQAWEKLVDRMLASPAYGERWARHWLDIAHYADTHGFERDQRRDNAWRYRDWVIRALNQDLPYDEFLRRQIAGDVMSPDDPEFVIATGFLAAGPWDFVGQAETPSPVLKRLARADDLDDMVTQVMTAACGVTVNCARCHDHKLDPITQQEYYSLWSVFSGIKRGDRVVSSGEERRVADRRRTLRAELERLQKRRHELSGNGWSLADLVGAGDGHGSGKKGQAVDLLNGKPTEARRGFLENAAVNRFVSSEIKFIEGVFVPDGGAGPVTITSSGLTVNDLPDTSGQAWDSIRNGPVNSQFSTELAGTNFDASGHSLLSLHANCGLTFDLTELHQAGLPSNTMLKARAGYFGQTPKSGASLFIYIDGKRVWAKEGLGRHDGLADVAVPIPQEAQWLTLVATDHGNGIGHDQICLADASLSVPRTLSEQETAELADIDSTIQKLDRELTSLKDPDRVYAAVPGEPEPVRVQRRGNPEDQAEEVSPGAITCVAELQAQFGDAKMPEGERRRALAEWITSPKNPLTARVIVNRLWQHHFGTGLVDTPGDFGLGGSAPSHPKLLDWLARRLIEHQWSLKAIHREICLSHVYQQQSSPASSKNTQEAMECDSGNRLLWRQNARRVDAETLRDSVLAVSGKLNAEMYGPGYRDFEYREEYAPVYRYITADSKDLWRRSIYRFIVRTTPDPFMSTLDCPNPANLTPRRNVTTTALQALALMNNEFMRKQATYFAERCQTDYQQAEDQIRRAFQLALCRVPSDDEFTSANDLVSRKDLAALCLALINLNEFVYVD